MLQQDNSRPHTAKVTMDILTQNNINALPFPDLNPIDNLWDELDIWALQRQPLPQSFDQLSQALQHEWQGNKSI
jgi:glycosyltransferase A (GT-A) superfamily protein (DUF2064 family)